MTSNTTNKTAPSNPAQGHDSKETNEMNNTNSTPKARRRVSQVSRIGRRAAPTATSTIGADFTIGGDERKPEVVDDGEYHITITGARAVTSKAGATSAILEAELDDGTPLDIRPLLVNSQGGISNMVRTNRAIMAALAGLGPDEQVPFSALLKRLAGREVDVEMVMVVDQKSGRPINEITDVFVEE